MFGDRNFICSRTVLAFERATYTYMCLYMFLSGAVLTWLSKLLMLMGRSLTSTLEARSGNVRAREYVFYARCAHGSHVNHHRQIVVMAHRIGAS